MPAMNPSLAASSTDSMSNARKVFGGVATCSCHRTSPVLTRCSYHYDSNDESEASTATIDDDGDIEMEDADPHYGDDTTDDTEDVINDEDSDWDADFASDDSDVSSEESSVICTTAEEFLESESDNWERSQDWLPGPVVSLMTPSDSKQLLQNLFTRLSQGSAASVVLLREDDLLLMQKSAAREGLMVRAYVPKVQYGTQKQGLLFVGWEMDGVSDLLQDVRDALRKVGFRRTARRLQQARELSKPRYMTLMAGSLRDGRRK